MRAVLDTNVLISALIKGGKPRKLMNILLGRRHTLILSEHMVAEFTLVSSDDKIKRYVDDDDIGSFLGAILSRATFVLPEGDVQVLGDDDDYVLAAANGRRR
ncbi:MAG: putative toxin-antitoxin system toxin component, PIN family [Thaumarchaeota archaeon]|nr:putative toxin-antitoxin system toxin component, PIN family [Nitrososphaerota archaeon]